MPTHCIRLTDPALSDAIVVVGALQFTKGVSPPMSEADAKVHLDVVAQSYDAELIERPLQGTTQAADLSSAATLAEGIDLDDE